MPFSDGYQNYDGVDIRLYRVENPQEFLKSQPNLHRLTLKGTYQDTNVAHVVNYLWDSWFKGTRRSWQRILSTDARKQATNKRPQLQTGNNIDRPTVFEHQNNFTPLAGFPLVQTMRYPIWDAKPVSPPKDTKLDGSSSQWIQPRIGNAMVSLGKLPSGLYIVEGIIGAQRATTLLFVSDTVAITKVSSKQMLVWTADRATGAPVANAKLSWTDGVGTLQSAQTNTQGLATLNHQTPEQTYIIGEDTAGGVFISENFYYDSEIYNTKLYSFTDRPLYRPNDSVKVKWMGRTFTSAQDSTVPKSAPLSYQVIDPSGMVLLQQDTNFSAENAANSEFKLPKEAIPGGYEIRTTYNGDIYSSSFRVANYVKPHFEMHLAMEKPSYKVGEALTGEIELRYANGKPVENAKVTVSVRSQQLSMVDGELQYAGMFPIKLEQQELSADSKGKVTLKLPAAKEPSRYIVTLLANDGAAFRVKSTQEILVERGINNYQLKTQYQFTEPKKNVKFTFAAQGTGGKPPVTYETIRLEDQKKTQGKLQGTSDFTVKFDLAGSYQVNLKDADGNVLGATNHWVTGDGIQTLAGSIEVVLDKANYKVGETAEALITFPYPVKDALLTLERDQVEQASTLSKPDSWVKLQKITPSQYKARIKIEKSFTPNMTFSVLSQQNGSYVFQNAGLVVAQPEVALNIKADKTVYRPRETVNIDINSLFGNQPVQAALSVSVVDEMVYVLQPEIAPSIVDFFYHPRRNNVRTTSSLNFIGYDMSTSYLSEEGSSAQRFNERGVKVLERPRRDDKDTAAWQPNLQTDAQGNAKLSFTMPDSLTRWRVTVRAMTPDGKVGQRIAYIQSEQPYYLKWVANKLYRDGDQSTVDVVAFNNTKADSKAQFVVKSGTQVLKDETIELSRGMNYLTFNLNAKQADVLNVALNIDGKPVDSLNVAVDTQNPRWQTDAQNIITLNQDNPSLKLPKDARNIELSFMSESSGSLLRVMDDLISYPYGCVEQTASRLIPLSMAYQASTNPQVSASLRGQILSNRLRLIAMAQPDAKFTWWGSSAGTSTMISAYAYYADWFAAKQIGMPYQAESAQPLLAIYKEYAHTEPVLHRTLSLWWMNQMGLPVDTLLAGVDKELTNVKLGTFAAQTPNHSVIFSAPESAYGKALAIVLSAQIHKERGTALPESLQGPLVQARELLSKQTREPLAQSLLLLSGAGKKAPTVTAENSANETLQAASTDAPTVSTPAPSAITANSILQQVSQNSPTLERSLALTWLQKAQATPMNANTIEPKLVAPWKAMSPTYTGQARWRWTANTLPTSLSLAGQAKPAFALIRYQTNAPQTHNLDVGLTRTLYQLVPQKDALTFKAEPVAKGATLSSNALYVDEITLTPKNQSVRYGLLEIPLPAGAEVEGTTWGMKIKGLSDDASQTQAFSHREYELGTLSYRVPVAELNKPARIQHLVRFNQRGTFNAPAARLFLMYQPDKKALQDGKDNLYQFVVK